MRTVAGMVAVMEEPLSPHERGLIEQTRKINKLLSLYVLAIQERKPLTEGEHGGLARALRSTADVVEQEGTRTPVQRPTNARPLIEGGIGDEPQANGAKPEA
jgi:hypothetical protein